MFSILKKKEHNDIFVGIAPPPPGGGGGGDFKMTV